MPGMAYIDVIKYESAEGELKTVYDAIASSRGKIAEVHTIQSLNPPTIPAHMELYRTVMFSHSPLSRAKREMIAVVVSETNRCRYCVVHHGEALLHFWKDQTLVDALARATAMGRFDDAGELDLTPRHVALCRFARRVTADPGSGGILEGHTATLMVMTTSDEAEAGTFRWRPLVRVSLAIAFYVGAEVTIFGWAPTVMELYHGVPAGRARLAPTLFWIGMLGGRIVIAGLTKRFTSSALLRVSALLGVAASVLLVVVPTEPLLWLAVALSSIACAGIWPLIVASSGETGHETGTTIIVAAGGLGAAVFPYLAGRISEVLPGHYILLMAAPLLLAVFFLSKSEALRNRD
jgi:uncharacterized peroxidase-related enzyme